MNNENPNPNEWRNSTTRYGSLLIGFHWLMVLLIIVVYGSIELRTIFPKGSDPREALKIWHFMLGLSVLFLVILRFIVSMRENVPEVTPDPPKWQKFLKKLMHFVLYVLLFGLPLTGWLYLSAAGKPIPFFGLQMPMLIDENKQIAHLIEEIHVISAKVGFFLICSHALAALYHHYVMKDNTLLRIIPGRK